MAEPQFVASLLARQIGVAIGKARINVTTEAAAHRDVLAALSAADIDHVSEVRLTPRDRIDVMCGPVGIEIKVKHPRREIWRQLQRYAALPEIEALVLATGTAFPNVRDVDGVPLTVVDLSRGWL